MLLMPGIGPAKRLRMLDRSHTALDDAELLEETPGRALAPSDAEVAPCNCPELCIRDHEYE